MKKMKPEFKPRPSDSSAHSSNYQILLSECYDHATDERLLRPICRKGMERYTVPELTLDQEAPS